MQSVDEPSSAVIEQAANWAALLDDAHADAQAREACNAWCAQHPSHRLAYDRMRAISSRIQALDDTQKRALAAASNANRVRVGLVASAVACIAMIGSGVWFAKTNMDVRSLWPGHVTGIGEQKTVALHDGSTIVLDTNTRADAYAGSTGDRTITLFSGQVLASVAGDPLRPFSVHTREGSATALGTQYSVRTLGDRTFVTVLESKVRVCPEQGGCRTLSAGQRTSMTKTGLGPVETIDVATESLWATGWIEVHDRALVDVLDELSRYSASPIAYDERQLTGLRITGSFPLTRPEAALRAIAETAPIVLSIRADGAMAVSRR